jgi:signal transduction histidine kinase
LRLNVEPLPIASVVREAWELLGGPRSGRQCELICDGDSGRRCLIDHFQVLQAFRNVLENALSAAADPVVVRVSFTESNLEGRPAVVISIRDNGPGVPLDKVHRIFEEFFTTRSRGTGLGLAIVRRVVESHGGSVRVNPDCHEGAEFLLTLPATPCEQRTEAAEARLEFVSASRD